MQNQCLRKITVTALTALTVGSAFSALTNEPVTEQRLALLKQAGYTYDRCYLKGIPVSSNPDKLGKDFVPTYSAEQFPYKWDFDDGTLCGINDSPGTKGLAVKDGKLAFTTEGAMACLSWGDIRPSQPPLRFGNPSKEGYPSYRMAGVQVRIRQSLPESVWGFNYSWVSAKYGPQNDGKSKPLTIKGTDWQTVVLAPAGAGCLPPPYTAFQLFSTTPGNHVEIDWIKPVNCAFEVAARKTINLPAKVRWAKFSLSGDAYQLYVNGQRVCLGAPGVGRRQIFDYELDPKLFHVGSNAIAIVNVASAGSAVFLMDGALLCEDGTYLRLDSDASWKRPKEIVAAETKRWTAVDFDDSHWVPVKVVSEVNKTDPQTEFDKDLLGRKTYFNPSWKGQLMVDPVGGHTQPVFGSKEPVALRVAVPFRAGEKQEVSYEVFDEMGDGYQPMDKSLKKGTLNLKQEGGVNAGVLEFKAGELPVNTAYAVVFKFMVEGKDVEQYRYEIAVCGPISQPIVKNPTNYTDGMELKLVWELDAAADQKEGEFISCGGDSQVRPSKVVTTPLGKFRSTYDEGASKTKGGTHANYMAFKYTIKNPGRPHLVLAEYPDDSKRFQEMRVSDGFLWQEAMTVGNDSVVLGVDAPLSHTIKQQHAIFFPNDRNGTVTFFGIGHINAWVPSMAAKVGKIRIYEIMNDVPSRGITDAPGAAKWFGQQPERGPLQIVMSCFSSPIGPFFRGGFSGNNSPYFYRNWLVTYRNMVKRLKFAGENCYYNGQYMYGSVLFPSEFSENAGGQMGGAPGTIRDYGVLMAKLFEENGLGWFSATEIASLSRVAMTCNDIEIAEGVDTLLAVDRNGQQMGDDRSPTPNWIRPECQAYFKKIMNELIALYGKEPAWQGITLQISEAYGPGWPSFGTPYDAGYDDYTIRLFEQETKLKIPVDVKDHQRFTKRYDWLMANEKAKAEWTKWRAAKMTELYDWVAQRLRETRPDLNLVLNVARYTMNPKHKGTPEDQWTLAERAFQCGIDWEHLQKQSNVVCAYTVAASAAVDNFCAGKDEWDVNLLNIRDNKFLAEVSNAGGNGVCLRRGWFEPQPAAPGNWCWPKSDLLNAEAWPYNEDPYLAQDWANVFLRTNPKIILNALQDCLMWNGAEYSVWRFARAFRSVPAGKYVRLTGNGLDKNVWIAVMKQGDDIYGYVANANWWDLDVTVMPGPGMELFDLIEQKAVAGGEWKVSLRPYDIRTFRAKAAALDKVLVAAKAEVSAQGQAQFRDLLTEARGKVAIAKEAVALIPGLNEKIQAWLAGVESKAASGDYDQAYTEFRLSPLMVKANQLGWKLEGYEPKLTVARKRTLPLALDGDLKNWGAKPDFTLGPECLVADEREDYKGPQDIGAQGFCQWDAENLYLAFRVTDDVLNPKIRIKDSVELYFDMNILGDWGEGKYTPDDFNFKLAPVLNSSEVEVLCHQGSVKAGEKVPMQDPPLKARWQKIENGYWLATTIPWKMLTDQPVVPGLKIGFDVLLIDLDVDKTPTRAMYWSTTKIPWADPRPFGRMVLGE